MARPYSFPAHPMSPSCCRSLHVFTCVPSEPLASPPSYPKPPHGKCVKWQRPSCADLPQRCKGQGLVSCHALACLAAPRPLLARGYCSQHSCAESLNAYRAGSRCHGRCLGSLGHSWGRGRGNGSGLDGCGSLRGGRGRGGLPKNQRTVCFLELNEMLRLLQLFPARYQLPVLDPVLQVLHDEGLVGVVSANCYSTLRSRRPHHPQGALTHHHKTSYWPACCYASCAARGGT